MTEPAPEHGRPGRITAAVKRVAGLGLLLVALGLLASSDSLHQVVLAVLEPVERIITEHPRLGATLFIVFSALSAMIAFFSTAVITPVAVETWGAGLSIALLWTGWMLGGVCAYGIGRSLGRPVVRALTSHDALDRFENRISNRAPFGLVLLFQLAMPSEVPGYVLGIARYQFLKYILILGMVELPFAVGTVHLGASFVQQRSYMLLAIGAAGIILTTWAIYTLQKRLSESRPTSSTPP
jgi:uncharacterized membrane protein YdjX (TVP38/TMEM64 family)